MSNYSRQKKGPSHQPRMAFTFLKRTLPFSELPEAELEQLALRCAVVFSPAGERVFSAGEREPLDLYLVQQGRVNCSVSGQSEKHDFSGESEQLVAGVRSAGGSLHDSDMEALGRAQRVSGAGSPAPDQLLTDVRGEGAAIGALALLENMPFQADVVAVEDSFFITLPAAVFLRIVRQYPVVGDYYRKTMPECFVTKALDEMRTRLDGMTESQGVFLFSNPLHELVSRGPEAVVRGTSLRAAASLMVEKRVGYLLVLERRSSLDATQNFASSDKEKCCNNAPIASGKGITVPSAGDASAALQPYLCGSDVLSEEAIIGIVTDSDLRKAVSLCMDYEAPIETIMSSPVISLSGQRSCFDGLLEMMRRQVHHLAVSDGENITGMVTTNDLMVMQGRTPMALYREISRQREFETLYPMRSRVASVVRGLVEEGAQVEAIIRMLTVFNNLLLEKVIELTVESLGTPPLEFCWLCMGSEGRREQTFVTDQDNGLIIADCSDDILRRAADVYFTALGEQVSQHLHACGFPFCEGNVMASNPLWRKSFSEWSAAFSHWILTPAPRQIRHATIFFDFRSGYGKNQFADRLRRQVQHLAPANEIFLHHMAADCLSMRPPLTLFRNFVVEKDGEHRNSMNIKARGIMPFVDAARVLALAKGLDATGTSERFRALGAGGHMPELLGKEARDAYGFIMQLRLVHQVAQLARGETPDNQLYPERLTELEKRTLKEAFSVAGRLQNFLKEEFHLRDF